MLLQPPSAVHGIPAGPAAVEVLQLPSTASSGRRLMIENFGGSYSLRRSGLGPDSMTLSPCLSVIRLASAAAAPCRGRHTRVVQYRQKGQGGCSIRRHQFPSKRPAVLTPSPTHSGCHWRKNHNLHAPELQIPAPSPAGALLRTKIPPVTPRLRFPTHRSPDTCCTANAAGTPCTS